VIEAVLEGEGSENRTRSPPGCQSLNNPDLQRVEDFLFGSFPNPSDSLLHEGFCRVRPSLVSGHQRETVVVVIALISAPPRRRAAYRAPRATVAARSFVDQGNWARPAG